MDGVTESIDGGVMSGGTPTLLGGVCDCGNFGDVGNSCPRHVTNNIARNRNARRLRITPSP